jgi:hypothetical protein
MFELVVCFVDIGGIVDHHCLNFHSGRIKPKTIKLVFVRYWATAGVRTKTIKLVFVRYCATAGVRTKTSWLAIRIMCPSEVGTVVSVS